MELILSQILGRQPSVALAAQTVPLRLLESEYAPVIAQSLSTEEQWVQFLDNVRDQISRKRPGGAFAGNSDSPDTYRRAHHFFHHIQLGMVGHQISAEVYLGEHSRLWTAVHSKIDQLRTQLLEWEDTLPGELKIDRKIQGMPLDGAQLSLALHRRSLEMILYRSCVGVVHIEDEDLKTPASRLSRECVLAAVSLVDILPNGMTASEIYRQTPWWNMLHYLCQAMAVFVLELSSRSTAVSGSTERLDPYIGKAMNCLWHLSPGSASAYKAWRIFRLLLQILDHATISVEGAGLLSGVSMPPSWTVQDELGLLEPFKGLGKDNAA
jgi:hypothetical protein